MNNEECIIYNGNLDEKGADGIWDLAGVICDTVWVSSSNDEQGLVYDLIRGYLERLDYCPSCGKRTKDGERDGRNMRR